MTLSELFEEIRLKSMNPNKNLGKISKRFNKKLKEIFTDSFIKKIYRYMPNKIKLTKSSSYSAYVIAKSPNYMFELFKDDKILKNRNRGIPKKSNRIHVGEEEERDISILIHEFVHLIDQRDKEKYFPEIGRMIKELVNNTDMFKKRANSTEAEEIITTLSTNLFFMVGYDKMFNKNMNIKKVLRVINKYKIFRPLYVAYRLKQAIGVVR